MQSERIYLGCLDRGLSGDDFFYVSRRNDGGFEVERKREFEQPFKTPDWCVIPPSQLGEIMIAGKTLADLVREKTH